MRDIHRHRETRSGERGQALAVFAGGLIALLVASGFVLDSGIAFVNRRTAQNAADMGALAGTREIAEFHMTGTGSGADVFEAIEATVSENDCGSGVPCGWTARYVRPTTGYETADLGPVVDGGTIPAAAQGVEVDVARTPPTYFLGVIGQDDWGIGADATALTARLDSVGEGILLPIAFDIGRDPLTAGQRYRFSEDKDGPGNFSWLSWYDINSATELRDNVCRPRNPAYDFPLYISGGPGKMNSSGVRDCLEGYVGKTVYVPLWGDGGAGCADGPSRGNGSNFDYCIVGVAAFHFEGYEANPAIDHLYGTFQEIVSYTSIPGNWSGPPCEPGSEGCSSPTAYLGLIR